jgi:membrane protease YdiL (CAAX protease family)
MPSSTLNNIDVFFIDNLGRFLIAYFMLLEYLPFLTLFGFILIAIWRYDSARNKALCDKAVSYKALWLTVYGAFISVILGVTLYSLGITWYLDNNIPPEDVVARISFLASPIVVSIEHLTTYGLLFFVPLAILIKVNRDFYLSIFKLPQRIGKEHLKYVFLAVISIAALGLLYWYLFVVVAGLSEESGIFSATTLGVLTRQLASTSLLLGVGYAVLMVPLIAFAEELIFRGIIYGGLKDRVGVKIAVLLSAVLFSIYHPISYLLIHYFAVGVVLAVLYEKSHSIYFPIAARVCLYLISILIIS